MKIMSFFKDKRIIAIILIIMILILFGILTIFNVKKNEYPVVYSNKDNDIIYLKDKKETILATNAELSDASFVMEGKYILYKDDNNLIIMNNNKNKIISKEVLSYKTIDDKYILILTQSRELISYDISKDKKIDISSNVDNIVYSDKKQVIFVKENSVYISKLLKKDIKELTNSYDTRNVTNSVLDGKYLFIISKESDLLKINIKNLKSKTIKKNIKDIYYNEDTKNLFALANNGELYFIKSDKSKKVDTDILEINSINTNDSITYIKNDGFYFVNKTNVTKLVDSCTDINKSEIISANKLYYVKNNSLVYVEIKKKNKIQDTEIDKIYVNTLNKVKKGYIYISINNELKYLKNDKTKKIDSDVESQEIIIGRSGKEMFYTKMIDGINTLYRYNFMKIKKVDSNVYKFVYVKQGLTYYLKNYDTPSDNYMLYKYTTKSQKITEHVKNILEINYKYE